MKENMYLNFESDSELKFCNKTFSKKTDFHNYLRGSIIFLDCEFKEKCFGPSTIVNCHFQNCTFHNVELYKFEIIECIFTNCQFLYCDLCLKDFSNSSLINCQFIKSDLQAAFFIECTLK